MATTQEPQDHYVEILQHRVKFWLRGEDAPDEMDEGALEHVEKAIAGGFREGELFVYGDDPENPWSGWWSLDFS